MSPALVSLILPGLGHWRLGRRELGLSLLGAALAIGLVIAWWVAITGQPLWWLSILPFWIAQARAAASQTGAKGATRNETHQPRSSLGRLAILGMLPVYLIGWQATEIDLRRPVERWAKVAPFFEGLSRPDFFDPVLDQTEVALQVWTPCNPEEPSALAELSEAAPSMRIEPACAALGERLSVQGAGFAPEVPMSLIWQGPTGDELELAAVETDDAGRFTREIVIPPDSIPARVRERRPDQPQDQAIRAVSAIDTGRRQVSITLDIILANLGITIALGYAATLMGAILALPLSLLGARNLMGRSRMGLGLYRLARALLNIVRSIESLILAVVFVVWVGPGPFAGVLALTVHTVAAIGKLFSEAIESIDEGPIEALRATGAGWLQVVRYAVLPQVLPAFTAFTVYRFDINIRMSIILGFVGGGGIGFILQQWILKSQWGAVSTAVLVIALILVLLDQLSASLRERITSGRPIAAAWLRPVLAFGLLVFTAWAWQSARIDLGRLAKDADKVRPILGQLLRPELVEHETIEAKIGSSFVACAKDIGSIGLNDGAIYYRSLDGLEDFPSVGDKVSISTSLSCIGEDDAVIGVLARGLPAGSQARLRWLLPDGTRLPAGSMSTSLDGSAEASIQIRPLVREQLAEGPVQIEMEVASPTGRMHASQPLRKTRDEILESILMALMAGSLGALLALPLAFLGARNIMPRRPLGNLVYYLSRSFMNLARAVEPLVLAAIFAVWMGLGSPFGGVLALIWVTMANLGKLFSESVEDIDAGPIEALEATGAGRLQRIRYAVLPQVLPPFLAFGIYQWDINLRLSVILGFVGAGGIGFALYEWMKVTQWRAAAVAILAIILVVTAMDTISARLRARLV